MFAAESDAKPRADSNYVNEIHLLFSCDSRVSVRSCR
jgi:hypothetical protein